MKSMMLWIAILLHFLAASASATTCVSFTELATPTSEELTRLNIKLTPLIEDPRSSALVFRSQGTPLDIGPTLRCNRATQNYDADFEAVSVQVDSGRVRTLLDSLATVTAIASNAVDSLSAFLSVSIIDVAGDTSRVSESIVGFEVAYDLVGMLENVLATHDSAATALSEFACVAGIGRPSSADDRSDKVEVSLRGFRLRRSDGRYVGHLRVTNTSAMSLTGPMIVALQFTGSVRTTNADGFTSCSASPPSAPYFTIPGASLSPGAAVTVPVIVENPNRESIDLSLSRVLGTTP